MTSTHSSRFDHRCCNDWRSRTKLLGSKVLYPIIGNSGLPAQFKFYGYDTDDLQTFLVFKKLTWRKRHCLKLLAESKKIF